MDPFPVTTTQTNTSRTSIDESRASRGTLHRVSSAREGRVHARRETEQDPLDIAKSSPESGFAARTLPLMLGPHGNIIEWVRR